MGLKSQIERLLADAERDYSHAASMHSMGKVSEAAGRVNALKAVLKLIE
jgi:hypothetical protein